MPTLPTSEEAREAVNVFTSIDVLGMLADTELPSLGGQSVEQGIKDYYNSALAGNPSATSLLPIAMTQPLQSWSPTQNAFVFNPLWDMLIAMAPGQYPVFGAGDGRASAEAFFSNYVRLIANRGDTQGWKLAVDQSDIVSDGGQDYLTQAFNLSVKAKPGQWIRWWGNSITPFSALQCVIGRITARTGSGDLPELENQQNLTVVYNYPSGQNGTDSYHTATNTAFSRMAELKTSVPVGTKIQYNILFHMVDNQGDIIASFQVDPEIIVIPE